MERLWRGMSGELRREWVRTWQRVQRDQVGGRGLVEVARDAYFLDFNMDRPDMQLTSEILLAEALNSTRLAGRRRRPTALPTSSRRPGAQAGWRLYFQGGAQQHVLNVDAAVASLCEVGATKVWRMILPFPVISSEGCQSFMRRLTAMFAYAHSSDCDPLMSGFLVALEDHVTGRLQFPDSDCSIPGW